MTDDESKVESTPELSLAPHEHRPPAQKRFHFTRNDQIGQLLGASAAGPEVGFAHRLIMLCSLPRTNPGTRTQHFRKNGPHTAVLSAVGRYGLPFGSLPRLLLAWICTEAVRTRSRELTLGRSFSEFMRKLNIYSTSGGTVGGRTRLRNQMNRLFGCAVKLSETHRRAERFVAGLLVERGELWWDPWRPDETVFWESKIELGEKFFNDIIAHPIPLDMHVLRALTRSSLGLDLYVWLNYRTHALDAPLRLAWRQLYRQFGVNSAKAGDNVIVQSFRKDCLRELKKIKAAWPGLDYATAEGYLVLLPTTRPSIPPLQFLLPR